MMMYRIPHVYDRWYFGALLMLGIDVGIMAAGIINKYETRFRSFKKYQPVSFGNFLKVKKYRNFSKKC